MENAKRVAKIWFSIKKHTGIKQEALTLYLM
jgi:hypothetical protein